MPCPLNLSARAIALQPSLTLAISARARALRADGYDICSLSAGEPDFETPAFIREAASEALARGATRYGPAAGEPAVRQAIATKLSDENGIPTTPDQVLVTNGGKQALFNLFQVLLGPGDELLLPAPYWLSYPEMAQLAGASVRLLPSEASDGFRLRPELLEAAITPASKLLVLNSPANPTGMVISRAELEGLAAVLRRHPQVAVVCDEIYEFLLAPGQQHHSFAAIAPDLRHRVFVVNGFAKGWAMTGWRLGYLAGPREVIAAASALQSQSTSNVCTFAQYGALAALQGSRQCVQAMAEQFNQRRRLLSDGLRALPGIRLKPPQGAFYAFPDVGSYGLDSMRFSNQLLEQVGLAVVPGVAFGDDRCIRLSCAASPATITDGLARLERFLASL
ncbi:pyridoxal phosphate-dependent aminotransferase [Synechococcus sp. CS-1325]|uniref:pyridoxal phosphate-dependent aminotransferase n=1 Tax=unclassified Synechococcus TaxID=2626047 RepID=UPI000DB6D2C1|nr:MULTISPECIES: pyridoxal phosphate-dependent aminotransferase [unclassified Synechococcus]PZU96067.1 MAG: aspartate aminotransferase [Cyanobium sp.]MCT0198235.1 pyridoxal phosphate-dependent aminotransferase [Synechococcus sp. CS-1325]MCT0213682.1 pyridoxal phosphate-dependent aminotransferase [Synechococcus sp. CS-1326]MCT0229551.1 pyridoxal phosphate-dependent aminotransferase [Synechococcus sp. CS-1324]MCT0234101.1 pyridoxal phosphate-dependent aminotransferase [Synechococcus sp. CS-1327]